MTTGIIFCFRNRNPIATLRLLQTLDAQTRRPDVVSLVNFGEPCPELEKPRTSFPFIYSHYLQGPVWCKGLALNQAARRLPEVDTILLTDADLLFAPNFLECGRRFFADFPESILNCRALNLPMGALDSVSDVVAEYDQLLALGTQRKEHEVGVCQWLPMETFRAMRGHDEHYKIWGYEDNDFQNRALMAGLTSIQIFHETSMLHQWHPSNGELKGELSEKGEFLRKWCKANYDRMVEHWKLWEEGKFLPNEVNPDGWGRLLPAEHG